MLKILIIDDEPAAGNILKILIEKHITTITEVHYCDNANDALELFKEIKPSLIMLDIEMPGMNGFDFLNLVTDTNFDVIFTTAYDKYAIKAIRFSALDYLLKPIDVYELRNSINRHIIKQQNHSPKLLVSNLISNLKQREDQDFKLALSTSDGYYFYEPIEVLYCEGDNNYTKFIFVAHKPLLVSKTLGEFEELLAEYGFLRIHKSFLINSKYVERVEKDGQLCMAGGTIFNISKRRREQILKKLKKFLS
jgi:two-component system LytT family response regulator